MKNGAGIAVEENVLLPVLIAGKKLGNYGKRLEEILEHIKTLRSGR